MANENILFVQPGSQNAARLNATISEAAYNNKAMNDLRAAIFGMAQGTNSFGQKGQTFDLDTLGHLDAAQVRAYLDRIVASNKAEVELAKGHTFASKTYEPFVFSFQNLNDTFPGPAKFYTGGVGNIDSHRWVLPVPPADIDVSVPNSPQSISTISGLTYSHAGNIDLEQVSFEGFFPFIQGNGGINDPDKWPAFIPGYVRKYGYHDPASLVTNFTTAMRANQPVLFSIFATNADQIPTSNGTTIIEPIAMSISSFDWNLGNATGGTRQDVEYKMTLTRWRQQTISVANFVRKPGRQ